MDVTFLVVVFALATMLAMVGFAPISKKKTQGRTNGPTASKSIFAAGKSA